MNKKCLSAYQMSETFWCQLGLRKADLDKKNTEYNVNIMIKHCLFPGKIHVHAYV